MAKLLDKLFWHTGLKLKVINWLLDSMPEHTKIIVLDRAIAKQLPDMHIGYKPYKKYAK